MSENTPKELQRKMAGAALVEAMKDVKSNWQMHLEIIEHQAMRSFAKYQAAISQGFTEQQALEICTKPWDV